MKIYVIKRKVILCFCLFLIAIGAIILISVKGFRSAADPPVKIKTFAQLETPFDVSLDEVSFELLMTFLDPYISEAVTDYYAEHTGYGPNVDPWCNKLLGIKRLSAYHFEVQLAVFPYLGAHNTIGVDYITFSVSTEEVNVEGYKHIKGYPIPPWLRIE